MNNNLNSKGIVNNQRSQVVDTKVSPYNSIVQVPCPLNVGNALFATGTVVGKNKILTSAHISRKSVLGDFITPGLNDGVAPFGKFEISKIEIPDDYSNDNSPYQLAYDYSIITVLPNEHGENISDVVPVINIQETNISNLHIGSPIKLIGYPVDKGSNQMWECPGELLRDDGQFYTLTLTFLPKDGDHFLAHSADSVFGNSGGPVINSNGNLIGVANLLSDNELAFNETGWGNGAVMMDKRAVEWISARLVE
jgi:V8-like Glu-specific endopeptidase